MRSTFSGCFGSILGCKYCSGESFFAVICVRLFRYILGLALMFVDGFGALESNKGFFAIIGNLKVFGNLLLEIIILHDKSSCWLLRSGIGFLDNLE